MNSNKHTCVNYVYGWEAGEGSCLDTSHSYWLVMVAAQMEVRSRDDNLWMCFLLLVKLFCVSEEACGYLYCPEDNSEVISDKKHSNSLVSFVGPEKYLCVICLTWPEKENFI